MPGAGHRISFPRLYAAASLKHLYLSAGRVWYGAFSAALCRGLIEARLDRDRHTRRRRRFSAALCRGLIEAPAPTAAATRASRFSAALCRGLIEARMTWVRRYAARPVFRGFMPRPH